MLKYLHKYVNEELAPFLGLHHWIFHISEEQCDGDVWSEIDVEDYDEATLKVGTKFLSAPPNIKVQVLIHELCHIPVCRIFENVEAATESLSELLHPDLKPIASGQLSIHYKSAHRAEESFVNLLGVILSPHAPKWKPPGRAK